jgi:hypothetical protein
MKNTQGAKSRKNHISDKDGADFLVRAFQAIVETSAISMDVDAVCRTEAAFDRIFSEFGGLPGLSQIYGAIMASAVMTDRQAMSAHSQHSETASVYFICRDDGMIKIGSSSNVGRRFAALSGIVGANIRMLATMPGGTKKEFELHGRFRQHRGQGEWFSPAPELIEFIDQLPKTAISEQIQPSLLN